MNCRHVQEALCPYLDGRLSGERMLEIQHHLDNCRSCADEFLTISEGKLFLRMLPMHAPSISSERLLAKRLATAGRPLFLTTHAPWAPPPPGRRLAKALAMSCVGSLIVAAPFGSGTQNMISFRPLAFNVWNRLSDKQDLLDPHTLLSSPANSSNFGSLSSWQASRPRKANTNWMYNQRQDLFIGSPSPSFGSVTSFADFQQP